MAPKMHKIIDWLPRIIGVSLGHHGLPYNNDDHDDHQESKAQPFAFANAPPSVFELGPKLFVPM